MDKIDYDLNEYLIKESEHVRKIYDERVNQTRLLERFSLLATGGIWSWCALHPDTEGVAFVIWIPAIIVFLFGIRAFGYAKAMHSTRDYIIKVENYISYPSEIGWGRHLKSSYEERLELTAYLFWFILQLLTILIPIIY